MRNEFLQKIVKWFEIASWFEITNWFEIVKWFLFFSKCVNFLYRRRLFFENTLILFSIFLFEIVLICFCANYVFVFKKKNTLLFLVIKLSLSIFEKKLTLFFFVEKIRSIVFSIDLSLQTRNKSSFILKILQLLTKILQLLTSWITRVFQTLITSQ